MIGTISGLREYAAARGIITPGLAVDQIASAALQRATDYIETFYVSRFDASITPSTNSLEWAAYEAAILEVDEPGFFNKTYTPGERTVLTEVQGIRWEVIPGSNNGGATPISARIEALLSPYLRGSFGFYVI